MEATDPKEVYLIASNIVLSRTELRGLMGTKGASGAYSGLLDLCLVPLFHIKMRHNGFGQTTVVPS